MKRADSWEVDVGQGTASEVPCVKERDPEQQPAAQAVGEGG